MRNRWLAGAVGAAGLAVLLWTSAVYSASVQCGGSFLPSLNCTIPGFWNFTKTDSVSGLPAPFQANGIDVTGLVSRTVDLTNAQILALNTTAVTIVPAPGAGKYVDVIAVDLAFNYTAAYTAGTDMRLYFASRTSGNAASAAITASGFLTSVSADKVTHVAGIPDNTNPPTTNVAVVLQTALNTAFASGDAANTLRVVVWYRIVATGL